MPYPYQCGSDNDATHAVCDKMNPFGCVLILPATNLVQQSARTIFNLQWTRGNLDISSWKPGSRVCAGERPVAASAKDWPLLHATARPSRFHAELLLRHQLHRSADLIPLLIQSLWRNRKNRADRLRESRHAILFNHPAIHLQLWIEAPGLFVF
jgi:hypothetical protein